MRLWHYKLIPYLPKQMLVSQWRELIAIKRQWEKGTLKHRLVSYVMDYDKEFFMNYIILLVNELEERGVVYNEDLYWEIADFCKKPEGYSFLTRFRISAVKYPYPEHNDRYLKQCLYNLQEKADRGIINKEEWKYIEDNIKINDWNVDLMEQVVSTNKHGDFTFKLPDINKIEIKTKEE